MMQYYVWSIYEAGSGFAFCELLDGLAEAQYDQLILGQKLDPVPEELSIAKISDGKIGDSVGTIWGLHIVSEKLRQVLPEDKVQFIPVKDVRNEIKIRRKYFLANVEATENMDREQSEVEMSEFFPDEIDKIKKLVVNEFKNNSPSIFKLAEVPTCILLSEPLKQKIESVTESGGQFIKVEDYQEGFF